MDIGTSTNDDKWSCQKGLRNGQMENWNFQRFKKMRKQARSTWISKERGKGLKGGQQGVLENLQKMGNLEKMLNVNWGNDNTGGMLKRQYMSNCGLGSQNISLPLPLPHLPLCITLTASKG